MFFQHKPQYEHFRNFGCLCCASILTQGRSKFDERATACVLIGYPLHQKGYKVLELEIKRLFISRDVKFFETYFPLAKYSPSNNPIFFTLTSSLKLYLCYTHAARYTKYTRYVFFTLTLISTYSSSILLPTYSLFSFLEQSP